MKNFSLMHHRSSMKIGTDAVLLGAWANPPVSGTILDAGTGCGILGLMMAQRTNCFITAIDIDKHSINEASENFKASPWGGRLNALNFDIIDFAEIKPYFFDFVICNPPYFINSLLPTNTRRKSTRHIDSLSLESFLLAALKLLRPQGTLALILPYVHSKPFINALISSGLHLIRKTEVRSYTQSKPIRYLLEFSKVPASLEVVSQLIIHSTRSQYSKEYKDLTSDFLLCS